MVLVLVTFLICLFKLSLEFVVYISFLISSGYIKYIDNCIQILFSITYIHWIFFIPFYLNNYIIVRFKFYLVHCILLLSLLSIILCVCMGHIMNLILDQII